MTLHGKIVEFKDVNINTLDVVDSLCNEYLNLIGIGTYNTFLKNDIWMCDEGSHRGTSSIRKATPEEISIVESFSLIRKIMSTLIGEKK